MLASIGPFIGFKPSVFGRQPTEPNPVPVCSISNENSRGTMSRWFRMYDDLIHDRKVQDLNPATFRGWINILCIASKHAGALPPINDIAFALRIPIPKATKLMAELTSAGLIDKSDSGLSSPHNWENRQRKADVSTDRVHAFRERQRNGFSKQGETH